MLLIWLVLCLFCASLLELIIGSFGIALPLVVSTTMYFTVVAGWRRTLLPALAVAVVVDVVLARAFPATPATVLAAMLLALFWKRRGDCQHAIGQVIPGALCGLSSGLIMALVLGAWLERWSFSLLLHTGVLLAHFVLGGVLLYPLLCCKLDNAAAAMNLPLYRNSQQSEEFRG